MRMARFSGTVHLVLYPMYVPTDTASCVMVLLGSIVAPRVAYNPVLFYPRFLLSCKTNSTLKYPRACSRVRFPHHSIFYHNPKHQPWWEQGKMTTSHWVGAGRWSGGQSCHRHQWGGRWVPMPPSPPSEGSKRCKTKNSNQPENVVVIVRGGATEGVWENNMTMTTMATTTTTMTSTKNNNQLNYGHRLVLPYCHSPHSTCNSSGVALPQWWWRRQPCDVWGCWWRGLINRITANVPYMAHFLTSFVFG